MTRRNLCVWMVMIGSAIWGPAAPSWGNGGRGEEAILVGPGSLVDVRAVVGPLVPGLQIAVTYRDTAGVTNDLIAQNVDYDIADITQALAVGGQHVLNPAGTEVFGYDIGFDVVNDWWNIIAEVSAVGPGPLDYFTSDADFGSPGFRGRLSTLGSGIAFVPLSTVGGYTWSTIEGSIPAEHLLHVADSDFQALSAPKVNVTSAFPTLETPRVATASDGSIATTVQDLLGGQTFVRRCSPGGLPGPLATIPNANQSDVVTTASGQTFVFAVQAGQVVTHVYDDLSSSTSSWVQQLSAGTSNPADLRVSYNPDEEVIWVTWTATDGSGRPSVYSRAVSGVTGGFLNGSEVINDNAGSINYFSGDVTPVGPGVNFHAYLKQTNFNEVAGRLVKHAKPDGTSLFEVPAFQPPPGATDFEAAVLILAEAFAAAFTPIDQVGHVENLTPATSALSVGANFDNVLDGLLSSSSAEDMGLKFNIGTPVEKVFDAMGTDEILLGIDLDLSLEYTPGTRSPVTAVTFELMAENGYSNSWSLTGSGLDPYRHGFGDVNQQLLLELGDALGELGLGVYVTTDDDTTNLSGQHSGGGVGAGLGDSGTGGGAGGIDIDGVVGDGSASGGVRAGWRFTDLDDATGRSIGRPVSLVEVRSGWVEADGLRSG